MSKKLRLQWICPNCGETMMGILTLSSGQAEDLVTTVEPREAASSQGPQVRTGYIPDWLWVVLLVANAAFMLWRILQ